MNKESTFDKKELLENFLFCVKEKPYLHVGNVKIEREVYIVYKRYVEEGLGEFLTPEDFFDAHYQEKYIPEIRNLVAEQTSPYQTDEFQDNVTAQIITVIIASLMIHFTFFPPLGEIFFVLSLLEIITLTIFYSLNFLFPKKEFKEQFEGSIIFLIYFYIIFVSMIIYDFFPSLGEFFLIIWSSIIIFTIFLNLLSLLVTRNFSTPIITFFYLAFQLLKLKEYLGDIIEPRYALIIVLVAIGYVLKI